MFFTHFGVTSGITQEFRVIPEVTPKFNSLYIYTCDIPHKSLCNYNFLQIVKQILCKCILCKILYTFVDGNKF